METQDLLKRKTVAVVKITDMTLMIDGDSNGILFFDKHYNPWGCLYWLLYAKSTRRAPT